MREYLQWILWDMFVRKKPNKSGSISVQVLVKSFGNYKVVKTLDSSEEPQEIVKMSYGKPALAKRKNIKIHRLYWAC